MPRLHSLLRLRPSLKDNLAHARRAFRARKWDEAVVFYRRVLREDPRRWQDAVQLGHALKESGCHAEALRVYLRVQAAEPRDVDIHVQLGHLHSVMNDPETAVHWYERALVLDETDLDTARFLGDARLKLAACNADTKTDSSDLRLERLQLIEEEIAQGKASKAGHAAQICLQLGRIDLAEAHLARYRSWASGEGARDRHDAARQTADFYWKTGNWADALTFYLEAEAYLSASEIARGALGRKINNCVMRMYPALHAGDFAHG